MLWGSDETSYVPWGVLSFEVLPIVSISCDRRLAQFAILVFFHPELEMPEKEVGQHTREHLMMPAWILPDFIVVHAQLCFRFLEAL